MKEEAKIIMMPKTLTAENGAKALLMGEFFEEIEINCPECDGDGCGECGDVGVVTQKISVSWTTIKDIYKMAVEHLGVKIDC